MVGCLVPDLVRGPIPTSLHPAVLAAASEHQSIDRATDRHRAFFRTRDRLRPTCDRYAGVVADIMLDHALASTWTEHHPDPLAVYAAQVGKTLAQSHALMPRPMRLIADRMVSEDWLSTYASHAGMKLTLSRVSRRIRERLGRPIDLTPAADTLLDADHRAALLADFAELWPDLLAHVDNRRQREHRQDHPREDPARRAAS